VERVLGEHGRVIAYFRRHTRLAAGETGPCNLRTALALTFLLGRSKSLFHKPEKGLVFQGFSRWDPGFWNRL
jgi:hypothetical protein